MSRPVTVRYLLAALLAVFSLDSLAASYSAQGFYPTLETAQSACVVEHDSKVSAGHSATNCTTNIDSVGFAACQAIMSDIPSGSIGARTFSWNLQGGIYQNIYLYCFAFGGSCPAGYELLPNGQCEKVTNCSDMEGQTVFRTYSKTVTDVEADGDIDLGRPSSIIEDGCLANVDGNKLDQLTCGLTPHTLLGYTIVSCSYPYTFDGTSSSPNSTGSIDPPPPDKEVVIDPPTTTVVDSPVVTPGPPLVVDQTTTKTDPNISSATITGTGTSTTLIINRGGAKITTTNITTTNNIDGSVTTSTVTNITNITNEITTIGVGNPAVTSPSVTTGSQSTSTTTTNTDGSSTTTTDGGTDGSTTDEPLPSFGDAPEGEGALQGIIDGIASSDTSWLDSLPNPVNIFPSSGGASCSGLGFAFKGVTISYSGLCESASYFRDIFGWVLSVFTIMALLGVATAAFGRQ